MRTWPIAVILLAASTARADEAAAPPKLRLARAVKLAFGASPKRASKALGVRLTVADGVASARVLLGGAPATATITFGDDGKLDALAVRARGFADMSACTPAFTRAYKELARALGKTDTSTNQASWTVKRARHVVLACNPATANDEIGVLADDGAELDLVVEPVAHE